MPKADNNVQICKVVADERLVFGYANVAISKSGEQVTDSHDHQIDPSDLEYAAYLYVLKFREADEMHTADVCGHLVESFFITPSKLEKMGLAPDALPQGWWVGFYVENDDAWAKVKDGTYKMFSIAGTAIPEEVE
jgi:hypothetical protein